MKLFHSRVDHRVWRAFMALEGEASTGQLVRLGLAEARAVRALDVLQVPDGCSRAGRACAACRDQGPPVAMAAHTETEGYES
jgi:hypothetical protein